MTSIIIPHVVPRERRSVTRTIAPAQREALGELISSARRARGWSRTMLARSATRHLKSFDGAERYGIVAVEVTSKVVANLENGTGASPMGNAGRRSRLLGICLALELDRAEVNMIAGGV